MARVRDFAGEAPLSEWFRLVKEQTDELVLLAKVHDSARSAVTRETVEHGCRHFALCRRTHRVTRDLAPPNAGLFCLEIAALREHGASSST